MEQKAIHIGTAVLVLALRVITREDLEMIPHGQKLAKILRIR